MKDTKPSRELESNPSRFKVRERPGDGSGNAQTVGPSFEAYKDNPHKPMKLARHAWLAG